MNTEFKDKIKNWTIEYDENNKDKLINENEKNYMKSYKNHHIKSKNAIFLLIGPSGSGKTTSIIEYINRCIYKNNYIPFIEIYYFTSSTSDEALLNYLKNIIEDGLYLLDDINELPKLEDFKDINKNYKRLIIFDDINNLGKKQLQELEKWSNSGRKFFSHIFFLSQNYFNVPLQIRRNINYLCLYKQKELSLLNAILKNHNIYDIDKEKFKKYYLETTKNKGDFLMLDLNDNSEYPLRHNFLDNLKI